MSKPVKIKRYKRSMGGQSRVALAVKRYAPIVLGAVLLVAIGFFAGRPLLKFISGLADRPDSSQIDDYSLPSSAVNETLRRDSNGDTEGAVINTPASDRVYYYTPISRLSSPAAIDSLIKTVKDAGADRCMFDLKDRDGYLNYQSKNQYGSLLISDSAVDLGAVVKKFSDAGIVPVARIYAFRDNMISTVERSTAVMFRDTETRWLDSSAALGGKAWANPASEIMRKYIVDITDEIMSYGITEIVYAGFSTPTGFSLADREFGATDEQLLGHLRTLVGTLKGRISAKGGYASWEFEYSAVIGGNWAQYLVHPYRLETDNVIVTVPADRDVDSAVTSLKTAVREKDIKDAFIWVQGADVENRGENLGSYFVN